MAKDSRLEVVRLSGGEGERPQKREEASRKPNEAGSFR